MGEIPFFSVVIATYNRDNIDVSIQSVLNQTFVDYELIVVDDHSDIPAIERCEILKDKRVCYYYLKRNGGAAVARNYGIARSRGKYIAFNDDDDEWYSNKLAVLYQAISNKYPDLVYHDAEGRFINEHLVYKTHKSQEIQYWPLMLYANAIGGTPLVTIKKKLLDCVGGFNENLCSDEDGELFIRISKYTNNILYVDQVLGIFNFLTQTSSLTKTLEKRIESRMKIRTIYQKDIDDLLNKKQKQIMDEFLYSDLAFASLLNYDKRQAGAYYWKTFKIRYSAKYLLLAVLSRISVRIIFYIRTKL